MRLHSTADLKASWQKRTWHSIPVQRLEGTEVTDIFIAIVPRQRPVIFFLTASDDRGAAVSTEHAILHE